MSNHFLSPKGPVMIWFSATSALSLLLDSVPATLAFMILLGHCKHSPAWVLLSACDTSLEHWLYLLPHVKSQVNFHLLTEVLSGHLVIWSKVLFSLLTALYHHTFICFVVRYFITIVTYTNDTLYLFVCLCSVVSP